MRIIPCMVWILVESGCKPAAPPTQILPPQSPGVVLDAESMTPNWNDGDTFTASRGDDSTVKARLAGYNTLESYGPVHRWGDWNRTELYALAKESGHVAAGGIWTCTTLPGSGGYGRALVDCPDLRLALLEAGLAHVFAMDSAPPQPDLDAQRRAIAARAGMWAKGVPTWLTTSLHSNDESEKSAYNRVCSTETGLCETRPHTDTYRTCDEVCVADSCMVYVPYDHRYGQDRASCLNIE